MNRLSSILIIVIAVVFSASAAGQDFSDSNKYKKKIKILENSPIHGLFPDAEEIYQVEYTEEFLDQLAATAPFIESQSELEAVQSPWINLLCLTDSSSIKNRVSFLFDGGIHLERVEIRLNSSLRWMFATVSDGPVWDWAVPGTYMDEYVEWTDANDTVRCFEMRNAFQITGSSGCGNAGYWDQTIPEDPNLLGVYTFGWMHLHADPADHPGSGPTVWDYRHGIWFQPTLTIVQ